MARFCAKCGAQVKENSKFCQVCGAKVGESSKANIPVKEQRPVRREMSTKSEKKKHPMKGVLIAVVAILAIIAIVGVFATKTSTSKNSEEAYEQPLKTYVEALNNEDEDMLTESIVKGYWMNFKPNSLIFQYAREDIEYSIVSVEDVDLKNCQDQSYYFYNDKITDGKHLIVDFTCADGEIGQMNVYVFETKGQWYLNGPIRWS